LTIGNYAYYQTLLEEDALEIALRESKEMYQIGKEASDLALALELSLAEEKEETNSICSDTGTSVSTKLTRRMFRSRNCQMGSR
jgi:hypothetical protein